MVIDPILDCLQRACLRCSIHAIFQLYPNTENQTQYSYPGVSYLATEDTGQSRFTAEHFCSYESHPFAGYFLFNEFLFFCFRVI